MQERLIQDVLEANRLLPKLGLAMFTWGNVSAVDRGSGLIAIKPSGVEYQSMQAEDIVLLDLDGNIVQGGCRPSIDAKTHLEIYKAFPLAGAVVHTHSRWATIWAQAEKEIPALGTTHADYFRGAIPVTRRLTEAEITTDYERNTGKVIVERFSGGHPSPEDVCAVLVAQHGPFIWNVNPQKAVEYAAVLEEVAQTACFTIGLRGDAGEMQRPLLDKHYLRKHGANACYGQKK